MAAEAEIESDHGAGNSQPLKQDVLDEALCRRLRQRGVELEHDGAGKAGRREQAQLGGLVGEAEQRLLRPEEAARMGLEGEDRGGPAERLGAAVRRRDHGAVAAMHAIEIADGDDRARKLRGERLPVMDDGERWRLLQDFGHRVRFGRRRAPALIAGELPDVTTGLGERTWRADLAKIKSAPPPFVQVFSPVGDVIGH